LPTHLTGVRVAEGMVDDAGLTLTSKFKQKMKELNPHIE
jgi:hypothetical protein